MPPMTVHVTLVSYHHREKNLKSHPHVRLTMPACEHILSPCSSPAFCSLELNPEHSKKPPRRIVIHNSRKHPRRSKMSLMKASSTCWSPRLRPGTMAIWKVLCRAIGNRPILPSSPEQPSPKAGS